MISAHGATLSVTNTSLVITPSALREAIAGERERDIAIADLGSAVVSQVPDPWDRGVVTLDVAGTPFSIYFAPGDTQGPNELCSLLDAARRGEAPERGTAAVGGGVKGLSFVGFDVETANRNWGSICQIGLVKIVDGQEVDRVSWLCRPPEKYAEFEEFNVSIHGITPADVKEQPSVAARVDQLIDFVGPWPLVAHNAQFDASALREACLATGREVPSLLFACSLAQARAAKLDVVNHKLPTLAAHFGVELDDHHDACADAAACAGVMVALARLNSHEGSLVDFVHNSGFALGSISAARVTPVLRDRSGATRALQAAAVSGDLSAHEAASAVAVPRGSNQASAPPWRAVATPDTVPQRNDAADPNSPLFGHNVTLTGEFEPFDKARLWDEIAAQGATVGKNVTKKTTILVVGEWATVTSKEKRARQLQDEGQDIEIWSAHKLLHALGLDEQPPF